MREDVKTLAEVCRTRHDPGVLAILAYGSCLRHKTGEGLIDLYVLTRDHQSVSRNPFARLFCRLLPPNVHYAEANGLRAKYAVLPLARFTQLVQAHNPYIWARFGQPCAVVFTADAAAAIQLQAALLACHAKLWREAAASSLAGDDAMAALERLLVQTYRTELRPETAARAKMIVNADQAFYEEAAARHLGKDWRSTNAKPASWRARRMIGKALSVGRLIKAGFTFQGGADYMAWKIERHSGLKLTITDWQRRHPVLGALMLLPKVLMKKGLR